ncbi:MAG: 1-acyl-sn-glycerol-3-phosphate acyltransferase [Pseudomonadota bacterium]
MMQAEDPAAPMGPEQRGPDLRGTPSPEKKEQDKEQDVDKTKEAFSTLGGETGRGSATWNEVAPAPRPRKSPVQVVMGLLRILGFVLVTLILLPFFFLARASGRGRDRRVAALWCGAGMWLSGLSVRAEGERLRHGGMLLCNHASWLDILVLGWLVPVHFVAKAEVASWPFFGWIGRISNTVFIERRRAKAREQQRVLAERVEQGQLLCLFPEGTSSDGQRVLPFKTTLFALFYPENGPAADIPAQPASIHYRPRNGLPKSFYGWWGSMSLFDHIWDVVCLSTRGEVVVRFHPPVAPNGLADRKALAGAVEVAVAEGRRASDR